MDFEYVTAEETARDCYLFLEDTLPHSFRSRFNEEMDALKISAFSGFSREINELWDIISDRSLPPVINKSSEKAPLGNNAKILCWIEAVIKQYPVHLKLQDEMIEDAVPLGLYADRFSGQKIVVFDAQDEVRQLPLLNIREIESHRKRPAGSKRRAFFINEYLAKNRTASIRLRVYHEANVRQKLQNDIGTDDLIITEKSGYDIYEFKAVNPMDYYDMLLGYGRSVIVEEPEMLRKEIIRTTKEALKLYNNP